MVKIVALFRKPSDVDLFNDHYRKVHLPLARKVPGLRKLEITRTTAAPIGDASFFVMAEMYYDSMEALNASNASPEGRALVKDLMSFAAGIVTVFFGEVED
jgi:uncharacterized protein (TIGR02118 family)